ncbi:WhiB family transcriptional regulator [Ornithinimicrobium flavum]|uniref:WhiB family transcriptional regulator n=1 Tax=Ornithinimicrobium flavum TaxID=1288636 RepID=UPI00106FB86F|nr:WhiB family transcriptional regulator [Ornithinimicrobium flavum]
MSNPVAGLEPVIELWEWQTQALCREASPDMFFHPEGERGPSRVTRDERAKALCARCPVLQACRTHALTVREPYGVWGGLTEQEREEIYRQQDEPKAG